MDAYTAPGVLPEGVLLTCSTGVYGHSVSKHLFAMLLALMKRLPQYRDQQRQAQWRDLGQARSLLDAEVLMVGTGDLGTSFARLCRALGAHTTGVRRDPARPAQGIQRIYGLSELDELLPRADVVALALPQSPKTVGLFGRERLLRLKEDAILLNGGRGSAVDCAALAEVLESGRLWGAGLDVTDPEPLPPEHPLWRQPRALIIPPHRRRRPPARHRPPHCRHCPGQPAPLPAGEAPAQPGTLTTASPGRTPPDRVPVLPGHVPPLEPAKPSSPQRAGSPWDHQGDCRPSWSG